MSFGRRKRPEQGMPSEEQIDAFIAEKIAMADVVRRLRDETRQGSTELLKKLLSYSGPVKTEDLRDAQHQARWKVYWDLRDLYELEIVTEEEVDSAWEDCEHYYGQTEAMQARHEVDQMVGSGRDPSLARAAASHQLPRQ